MRFEPAPFACMVGVLARTTMRRYLASKAGMLGGVALLLVAMPFSLRLGMRAAESHRDPSLLLLGLFAYLALVPLATAGAFGDVSAQTRLRRYPVSPATRAAALAVAGFVEVPLLLALPPLIGLTASGGARALLALPLFVCTSAAVGQAMLLGGGALVERRAVREAISFAIPVLALFALVAGVPVRRLSALWEHPIQPSLQTVVRATPPGLATTVLRGDGPSAMAASAGLLLWFGVSVSFVVQGLDRERSPRSPSRPRKRSKSGPPPGGPLVAMARKEACQIVREPYLRGGLTQGSVAIAATIVIVLQPPNTGISLAPLLGTAGFAYLLLWCLQLVCNPWGSDSAAGATLWTFPTARTRWLLGKNLVHATITGTVTAGVIGLIANAAQTRLGLLGSFLGTGVLAVGAAQAMGNLLSAIAPFALVPRPGRQESRPAGQSFGTGVVHVGVALLAASVAAQPWGGVAIPLAYGASVPVAAGLVRRREREIADALER